MIASSGPSKRSAASFRTKLLAAMMLVVSAITASGFYLAQRNVTAAAKRDLQQNFQAELSSLDKVQKFRHAAIAERCSTLASPSLHAKFYRFLDASGAVLSPPNPKDVGELSPQAEAQLGLKQLAETQQIGYAQENIDAEDEIVDEIVAVPIFSTETGNVISALIVGFTPFELSGKGAGAGMESGIWINGRLHLRSLSKAAQSALGRDVTKAVTNSASGQNNLTVTINGAPQLLFYRRLNPDSLFPPAYEICVYSLADS